MDPACCTGHVNAGSNSASAAATIPLDSMEIERGMLEKLGYSKKFTKTFLASLIRRVYNSTWCTFSRRAVDREVQQSKVPHVLAFLQEGLGKGLSANTLQQQVATLGSGLGTRSGHSLAVHPDIKHFLRGYRYLIHSFPSWDLNLVLKSVKGTTFELLARVPLKICYHICQKGV